MVNLFEYILRSGIILTVLYGIYWFFLRTKSHSEVNRYYLIAALIISSLFPLFPVNFPGGDATQMIRHQIEPILITPSKVVEGVQGIFWTLDLPGFIYLLGSSVLLIRLGHQLLQITFLIRKYGTQRINGTTVVQTDQDLAPFSVFNVVFISKEAMKKPGLSQILEHEKAHIRQFHTLDLLLVEILVVFHWFNPVIWQYKRSFRCLHEYLADRSVLHRGNDLQDYQQLLLTQTFGVQFSSVANFFNRNLIKNRFIMMTKEKNTRVSNTTLFIVFPVALITTLILSSSFTDSMLSETLEVDSKRINTIPLTQTIELPQDDPVFTVVEKMPSFKGGKEALVKYLVENIQYPEEARKNNIQGMVYVTFVIEKDGSVTSVRSLKGVHDLLDREAVRVVEKMPAWNPGKEKGKPVRVQFNLPIDFKLDEGKEAKKIPSSTTPKEIKQYQKVKKDLQSDGIH